MAKFLAIGTIIFVLAGLLAEDEISYDVEVRDADIKRLSDHWSLQMRRPPTQQELDDLVTQFIKDEIYYRESQRLELDTNDAIVRRRMVQKLTFLTEDIAASVPLSEVALREYFEKNQDDYLVPATFTFTHRYFSSDRRADAQGDAERALRTEDPGDPFMLQKSYNRRTEYQIRSQFGEAFAQAISALRVSDQAQGPIESAYGWHTVTVSHMEPAHVPEFSAIADQVADDAQQAARQVANQAYYEELKTQYNVSFPDQGAE